MAKLIFERAIHRNDDTGELESYWPEHWPLPLLAAECIAVGSQFFAASYMNDASSLEGNKLQSAWLMAYMPEELILAREAAHVDRGMVYVGVDPSAGGQGTDPDMMAMWAIEVINNKGFGIASIGTKKSVEEQPQFIESWLDQQRPDMVVLEDTSAKGFVGTAMLTQINNGTGSKWPIKIETPQGARDKGGKERRLMAMAARFQNGQVRIPGINMGGDIKIDPRWDLFASQWRSFPVGHDDVLDAAYWACYHAFAVVEAGNVTIGPEGMDNTGARSDEYTPATDARGRRMQPIGTRRPRQRVRWNS